MTIQPQSPLESGRGGSPLARFGRGADGSVAIVFAVAAVAMLALVGGAVDYARLTAARAKLQAATDSAVLTVAATAKSYPTLDARLSLAKTTVQTQFQIAPPTTRLTEPVGQYIVSASADVPLTFMKAVGRQTAKIATQSTAVSVGGAGTTEIALALDNTGSMKNVIGDLRTAANNFVNTVFANGGTSVKMSIVPYVAAVNPGLTDMTMVDTQGKSLWNGFWWTNVWVAHAAGCTLDYSTGTSGSSGSGTGLPPVGSGSSGDTGSDASDFIEMLNPFRRHARALFGATTAHAADVTPNTTEPMTAVTVTNPYTGKVSQIPDGFQIFFYDPAYPWVSGRCDQLSNPPLVSHYDLYKRVLDQTGRPVTWKGCVEARPSAAELIYRRDNFGYGYATSPVDYDITDTPPDPANPPSLFVPYFWPDEPDLSITDLSVSIPPGPYDAARSGYHNNYITDGPLASSWGWELRHQQQAGWRLFTYNTKSLGYIKETYPDTYGPNAACPEPLTRLTSDKTLLSSKVNNMGYWYNGGTIISEGLTWAWRTLSPNAPYKDGKAYDAKDNKKIIVLMTDGVNGLASNGDGATFNMSDYSAYGYLGSGRIWQTNLLNTYDALSAHLDKRTLQACTNAKAKGITIYTVLFAHGNLTSTQIANSVSLLTQCASQNGFFYQASDLPSLNTAFATIAGGMSNNVRLVK